MSSKKNLPVDDQVLLFDFDGTLVETEFLAREVIVELFRERGVPDVERYALLAAGKTWRRAVAEMEAVASGLGVVLGNLEFLERELKRRYQERYRRGVRLIPGFLDALPRLRSRARFLGIVTGSERHEVDVILGAHGLRGYFDRVWGFGDYSDSKPDPSPYLTALREIPAQPSEVLVFEDSSAGMESAYRAGLRWVQIAHENHAKSPDPRSLFVVPDWRALEF